MREVTSAIERLPLDPGDPTGFYEALAVLLRESGLPWVGACWHLTDPATGMWVWSGHTGELPGDFHGALELEFQIDDFAKFGDLARRRTPVAALSVETGGQPERSARYRAQLAPGGVADELRVAFVDRFGRWGSLGLFSDAPYSEAALDRASLIVPLVARRLRESVVAGTAAAHEGPPGVALLDASDRILSRDARAGELLAAVGVDSGVPGAVHVLAARARISGAPVRGRTLTVDGAWLSVDASPLEGGDGGVALVLREASAPSLIEVRLRAAGLTEREREIAGGVLRGDDTATIAGQLHLSPWTVQDHLKSVWAKTGVRSRRDFVAKWAYGMMGVTN